MRISDWSSDVCSSDLHAWLLWYLTQDRDVTLTYRTQHNGLLQQLLRYFPEALTALLLMLIFAIWHLAQRQGPLLAPPDRGRRQLQEQIGRASCRERGCQYVEIPGVAGQLKKKK